MGFTVVSDVSVGSLCVFFFFLMGLRWLNYGWVFMSLTMGFYGFYASVSMGSMGF